MGLLSIGGVKLGLSPKIAGVISDKDVPAISKDKSLLDYADILEVRIDMFKDRSPEYLRRILSDVKRLSAKPLIATVRDVREGGRPPAMGDDLRFSLFKSALPFVDAADIEIRAAKELVKKVVSLFKKNKKVVIGSYHDFRKTPDAKKLKEILLRSKTLGCDILKIAAYARTRDELARLSVFTVMEKKKNNIVTISMGDRGLISRIFNPMVGSLFTYGYVNRPVFKGQGSVKDIAGLLAEFDPDYR